MAVANDASRGAARQDSVFDMGRLSDLKRDVKKDPEGTDQQKQVAKQFEAKWGVGMYEKIQAVQ